MKKLLNNVLIKLTRGGYVDRVLYIDNVPEELLFEDRHPLVCRGEGQKQAFQPDTEAPKVPTLRENLKRSQTGDNGIVFDLDNEQSKQLYMALDRYIKSVYTNKEIPASPVPNSTDPTSQSAPALELSKVPRVVLPSLSPSAANPVVEGSITASLDVESLKKEAIREYEMEKAMAAKERMAKARAARTGSRES